jgi:hypothetical protein
VNEVEVVHTIACHTYKGLSKDPEFLHAYVHPPIVSAAGDESYFFMTHAGRRFKVNVREISVEEELAATLPPRRPMRLI